MDIFTQGLMGGVLAQTVAHKEEAVQATLIGIFAGLLADADIFISSSTDPLLTIEYHRHFTHSLFFIPFGAAIAMLLLWPLMRRRMPPTRLYLFCFTGYSLSGVLDACTSYGTYLLWPLVDERIAWHIVSIIDPIFALILLITLLSGLRNKNRKVAITGLSLCVLYMSFGVFQLQRAEDVANELIASRGHIAEQHVVKPTLGNLLLWRSVYISNDRIYVDAVRVGLFSGNKLYKGGSVERFTPQRIFASSNAASTLQNDIQRFTTFSDGYVAIDPTQPNVLGDIRYSMLPTSVRPLWGIKFDKNNSHVHAEYRFFRDNSQEVRDQFLSMLLGK